MQPQPRRHAIVLGSSMAGLGAARALSSHFEHVTIVERDALSERLSLPSRKGVPQGNHGHGLLASGYQILDAYFPGMMDELVAEGASPGDGTRDFLWYQLGAWKLRAASDLRGIVMSRPLLEAKVRSRVRALTNVSFLAEHEVEAPVFEPSRRSVIGALVRDRRQGTSRRLDADLVVDATGRGSLTPRWLSSWGFGETPESLIRCNVGYASATFERRPGDFMGAIGGIVSGTPPCERRAGAVFAIEDGQWLVTLAGSVGDHPPSDPDGFRLFARSLPTQDVFRLVADRESTSEIRSYRFAASRRRHYRSLARFPDGYVVLGDALCSFNPIYGQGMSVALGEAKALDECLGEGVEGIGRRFLERADALIDVPWAIAAGEDMRYPEVEGRRPPGFSLVCRYMDRVHRAASRDPVVLKRFFEVANLLRPASALMTPGIAFRVLLGDARAQRKITNAAAMSPSP